MLAELRQERAQIEQAIAILEQLARGRGKRRGRPPLWVAEVAQAQRRSEKKATKEKKDKSGTSDD